MRNLSFTVDHLLSSWALIAPRNDVRAAAQTQEEAIGSCLSCQFGLKRAGDEPAPFTPTGVLIVSFERDSNEVEYRICRTASGAWSPAMSILVNFDELQAGDQLIVSDESL